MRDIDQISDEALKALREDLGDGLDTRIDQIRNLVWIKTNDKKELLINLHAIRLVGKLAENAINAINMAKNDNSFKSDEEENDNNFRP